MELVIDIDDSIPTFAQPWVGDDVTELVEQIKRAVRSGNIGPGHALPSIRQLANDLELDRKTVAKAYRLLERDSVIQSKGYRGTFVHQDAKAHSA